LVLFRASVVNAVSLSKIPDGNVLRLVLFRSSRVRAVSLSKIPAMATYSN
jgi:hypothetical protein